MFNTHSYQSKSSNSDFSPKKIVVFLHGYGADGADLISLAPVISDAARLEDFLFLSPDAPHQCEVSPFGKQWFSLLSRTEEYIESGLENVLPSVSEFLESVTAQYGLKMSDVILIGFSQGTMLALYTALRLKTSVAAVIGFSGALFGNVPADVKKFPVLLIHGKMDEVVPYAALSAAVSKLSSAGFAVESVSREGLGHGIDEAGLIQAVNFIKKIS